MATTRKTSTTASRAKAAGAKTPQDRQTASNDVENTIQEFDWRGHTYEIDSDDIDDVEFIEALQTNLPQALRILLGRDQHNELMQQLKDTDPKGKGRARMSEMREFFEDLNEFLRPLGA